MRKTRAASPAPNLVLSEEQIQSFSTNGYLTLPAISTPEEVATLREVLDRLVETRAGFREGSQFDMLGETAPDAPPRVLQILNPVNYAPELRHTLFRANALAIARQILGKDAGPFFEHAILKPPRQGEATPWHQDEAFRLDPRFEYRQLSLWMPLQEATADNGCMRYLPGSHEGELLPHRPHGGDRKSHALECCGAFDDASAVSCPLPAGGCVMHDGRTLHSAGPNATGAARWAYVLVFDLPPRPLAEKRDFPWRTARQSADMARKRRWLMRGGLFVETWRWVRMGMPLNINRLRFLARRALHDLIR